MTPRQIIEALENQALQQMAGYPGRDSDKRRVARTEIAMYCQASDKTVYNWRYMDNWTTPDGKGNVGRKSRALLENFARYKGVL